jgi:thioredoxin reductase (NADPH)
MKSQNIASKPTNPKGPWDTVIIGSGPSGLSAAIYTTRGAASTLILGGEVWGGQLMLTTNVDNFPGFPEGVMGPTLMEGMRKQAERFGAEFIQANVKSIDPSKTPFEITADGKTYLAKTIIIATGAQTKWLDAPGVKELIGKGVSSCAPCDAPFFKDKRVAVVGGGDSAMEEALVLTKYATEVTLIHRRNEFKASVAMQKRVKENPKIKLIMNTEVVEVKGTDKLEKLILKNVETNETSDFPIDGLFIAIGHVPSTDIFKGQIDLDERGFITNNGTRTNVPGVFVSGDVHDHKYKQAITAAGFGCMAGMDVLNHLTEEK